jgi:hypothetical protein
MKRVVLALVLLGLAGCGAQTTASSSLDKFEDPQEKAVAQKVEDLEADGKRGKVDDICSDILAQSLVSQLNAAGTDCPTEIQKAIDDANEFDLETQKVTINGNTATAEVKQGDKAGIEKMQFTREKNDWRATSLSD